MEGLDYGWLKAALYENKNDEQALAMSKYMKDQFPFLGVKSPKRTELTKVFFHQTGILKKAFDGEFVRALWNEREREYQYVALEYIDKLQKRLSKDDFYLMKDLIVKKSWWDTVDMLAQKPIGTLAKAFPELIEEQILDWATDQNMWLRRSAILFQMKYKQQTDEDVIYQMIKLNANSKEFFIQKAIGWALREYSKTNSESVSRFIQNHSLAPLSVREGSKYIKK